MTPPHPNHRGPRPQVDPPVHAGAEAGGRPRRVAHEARDARIVSVQCGAVGEGWAAVPHLDAAVSGAAEEEGVGASTLAGPTTEGVCKPSARAFIEHLNIKLPF